METKIEHASSPLHSYFARSDGHVSGVAKSSTMPINERVKVHAFPNIAASDADSVDSRRVDSQPAAAAGKARTRTERSPPKLPLLRLASAAQKMATLDPIDDIAADPTDPGRHRPRPEDPDRPRAARGFCCLRRYPRLRRVGDSP